MTNTAEVPINSPLKRRAWMKEGMVQEQSKSFWSPLKGTSLDAVIYQAQTSTADAGHTIVFDISGNYAGAARTGKEKAFGYGGVKLKFSDKLEAERLRYPISNGDKFDGVAIGDLAITEHTDSRQKLSDNWVRQNDQFWFDIGQGYLRGVKPTHGYQVGGGTNPFDLTATDIMSYDVLLKIDTAIKTGKGYTTGGNRRPMKPYQGTGANNGANPAPTYLLVLTAGQVADLKQDTKFQTIVSQADVRGRNNMALSGVLGKVGNLVVMEAPSYFGYEAEEGNNNLGKNVVEMSGLRRLCKVTTGGAELFEGTAAYDTEVAAPTVGTVYFDRGLIIGAGAFQEGLGMDPDYKFQSSDDFGIDSESLLEWWGQAQACILKPETEDYKKAKIGNMTYGLAYLDTFVSKNA